MVCSDSCRKMKWTSRVCHCGSCHRTFTALTTFDQHRVNGICSVATLVEKDGVWGNWGSSNGWWGKDAAS